MSKSIGGSIKPESPIRPGSSKGGLSVTGYQKANNKFSALDLAEYTGRVAFVQANLAAMKQFSKVGKREVNSNLVAMQKFSKMGKLDLNSNLVAMQKFSKMGKLDLNSNLVAMQQFSQLAVELNKVG